MKNCVGPFLSSLLSATLVTAILSSELAQAQSTPSADKKDQEIELLKLQVKQLQQQVNNLQGLNEQVKAIRRKIEVQGQTEQVETTTAREQVLQMPNVKASDEGFRFSSPNDDYRI